MSTGKATRRGERGEMWNEIWTPIRFGSYNIRIGRNRGLESALRGVSQANLYMGFLQETKLVYCIYTRRSAGYSVVAMDVPSQHTGVLAVFYRASPRFSVDALQQFRPNIFSFQIVMGERQLYILRCYLAPENALTIGRVVVAVRQCPRGS